MGMNLDFGTHKKSPFPLKRGVSSIKQVTNTKIMITFIRDKNFVSPEWGGGGGGAQIRFSPVLILLKNFEKTKKRSWVT